MNAIILAAGIGSRLFEITHDRCKCMAKVGSTTLIGRMLSQLDNLNLNEIFIVTGYKEELLKEYINSLSIRTKINYIYNNIFDVTNNIYSMYLASEILASDDAITLESDIIIDDNALKSILTDSRKNLVLVDKYRNWMDGTCVTIDGNDYITSIVCKQDFNRNLINSYYKTINIYKFSKDFSNDYFVPQLKDYMEKYGNSIYYEQALEPIITNKKGNLYAKRILDGKWYEIDDMNDLNAAVKLFYI